jgi:YegS C-terminal NAD kinase beta sandwich-like domain
VCPDNLRVVPTDRDLRDWVVWHRSRGLDIAPVGISGGDVARTAGGGSTPHPSSAIVTLDVMRVSIDGAEPTWGVAHVVARRNWLSGELVFVMNAQFLGAYDLAPRSHPNDGKLNALRVDPAMSRRERLQARQRSRTGTHLPHPSLTMRSVADIDLEFATPLVVWVDGARVGSARRLSVSAEPDALTAYV